ncbi:MAG: RelA/SpoT family protein [Candidatus Nanopelagicaceae bacterium]|jgi:GTP pyrophosphokinase
MANETIIAPLLASLESQGVDRQTIVRAFEVAVEAHAGQLRKSGEAYITHPVAVAEILGELGMNTPTIVAALLHDTVEDTPYSLVQLRADFGSEVADLVDGVTKLDRVIYGPDAEAETVRKMVIAMSRDIRVLVIKLADRLHNARTWKFLSEETVLRKARETLDIYAPLAHRLGMNAIKWELEDLSFAALEPKKFDEITRLVAQRQSERKDHTDKVIAEIKEQLSEEFEAVVTGRYKHYFSIYQKMVVRGREFNEIYDLTGVRVLVNDVKDCYGVLGAIHAHWSPVPGRFKDYIAMPKFNLYQSLHTTVIGPDGRAIEIQIRTHEMHRRAEFGIAAHWKYKSGNRGANEPEMAWLKQLHEWQKETADPEEFLESLRFDLGTPEVFIFTPKGSVIALPAGSTPVDFAYAVHTEIGNRCVGAKVNGRLVSLSTTLGNGDVVEVVTSKGEGAGVGPSRDWLNFVQSPRARSKIKAWFTKERKEEAIDAGKESIARQLRKQGAPLQKIFAGQSLLELAHELKYPDITALYAAVGDGHISAASVVEKLLNLLGVEEQEFASLDVNVGASSSRKRISDSGVEVIGVDDLLVKLARCCTPVPGDEITGFITKGSGVSVHRQDCINVGDLQEHQGDRFVSVRWTPGANSIFLVNIQVEALDRARLLSDVTRALSDNAVNILHASVSTAKDRTAFSKFTFEMADASHLEAVLKSVRAVPGVYDVYRVTNN